MHGRLAVGRRQQLRSTTIFHLFFLLSEPTSWPSSVARWRLREEKKKKTAKMQQNRKGQVRAEEEKTDSSPWIRSNTQVQVITCKVVCCVEYKLPLADCLLKGEKNQW